MTVEEKSLKRSRFKGRGRKGDKKGGTRGKANLLVLGLLVLVVAVGSLAIGRYSLDVPLLLSSLAHFPEAIQTLIQGEETTTEYIVIYKMRLPRIIAAILVGGSLGMAGAAFQGMFRNPMASPDLLGASYGAAFGAACAMLASASTLILTGSAFIGGITAVFLAYTISAKVTKGSSNIMVLILAGIVVSAMFEACISITKYVADPYSQLPGITFFLMGGLSSITWQDIGLLLVPVGLGCTVLYALRWRINILSLDDNESKALGMNTEKVRALVIVCATLITAVSVAVSGVIGWVGLVIPHFMRMLVGPDYRKLLPASFLGGSLYLLLMDNIARGMFPMEIPIGILTALIGAPVFIFLLLKYRGGWS